MRKPITVTNEQEFERLRERIDREVSHARHHWYLLKALEKASVEYWREMNESNTFWHLTFIAHRDAVLAHLGRVYDKTIGSLSLARFLEIVTENPNFFSDDARRDRLKDNAYVESLVRGRRFDAATLDADLQTVSNSDPLVKVLHDLRNKAIAHTDGEAVKSNAAEAHKRWLPADEIETLLNRATDITGKYSLFFGGSYCGGIACADDFMGTLRWVRKALTAHDAEIDKERERALELGLL
jgi:hypothetical protein